MADEPGFTPETESEEQQAARSRPQATEIKPPSATRRMRYNLFNRETRSGRFFRGLLRWLLTIILLLGAGLLAAYLLFYQPLDESMKQVSTRATESAVDLQRAQKELDDNQTNLQRAQANEKEARERLDVELTRVQLLRAVAALRSAQSAVQSEDQAAAETAITEAEQTLEQTQTQFDRVDPSSSSTLSALFTLVRNGLDRDMAEVGPDIERLIEELNRLDTELASQPE